MKKLIGWYKILNDKGLIAELTTEKTTAEETTDADSDATDTKKTDKPIAEKSTKPKKETKPHIEKTSKASSRVAGGGARKTVTPRKAS